MFSSYWLWETALGISFLQCWFFFPFPPLLLILTLHSLWYTSILLSNDMHLTFWKTSIPDTNRLYYPMFMFVFLRLPRVTCKMTELGLCDTEICGRKMSSKLLPGNPSNHKYAECSFGKSTQFYHLKVWGTSVQFWTFRISVYWSVFI